MNTTQRRGYFRRWQAACAAQGWDAGDEALRRDVTREATGAASSTALDNDDITRLYRYLDHLADPLDLRKAVLATDPDAAVEENRRRQLVHHIEALGFSDAYVARPAQTHCERERVEGWRSLSAASLTRLRHTLTTRGRARDARAGQRPPFVPRTQPYTQRPATKARRAASRQEQVMPRPGVAGQSDPDFFLP